MQQLIENNQHDQIVDPTEDKLYLKRKRDQTSDQAPSSSAGQSLQNISKPPSGWGKVLPPKLDFDDIHIKGHVANSGKRASKFSKVVPGSSSCIKPETRGHQFYIEGYVHDITCQMVK